MNIDTLIDKLLSSYDTIGLINRSNAENFPNRQNVVSVLQDLQSLVFPGFKYAEEVDPTNLRYVTGQKVNNIIAKLTKEIQKSLIYTLTQKNGTAEKIEKKWKCFNVSIFEMFPAAEFPEKFLNAVGSAWRTVLDNYYKDSRSEVVRSDKLRTLHMKDGNGTEILSMFSYSPHYIAPEVYFVSSSAVVHKVSSFPEIELINSDGRLWTEIAYAPPNIPPKGVLTLKITEK
jgi:hypothetical protein